MKTTGYFDIVGELPDEEAGRVALARGEVQFVLNIPAGFTRRLAARRTTGDVDRG